MQHLKAHLPKNSSHDFSLCHALVNQFVPLFVTYNFLPIRIDALPSSFNYHNNFLVIAMTFTPFFSTFHSTNQLELFCLCCSDMNTLLFYLFFVSSFLVTWLHGHLPSWLESCFFLICVRCGAHSECGRGLQTTRAPRFGPLRSPTSFFRTCEEPPFLICLFPLSSSFVLVGMDVCVWPIKKENFGFVGHLWFLFVSFFW